MEGALASPLRAALGDSTRVCSECRIKAHSSSVEIACPTFFPEALGLAEMLLLVVSIRNASCLPCETESHTSHLTPSAKQESNRVGANSSGVELGPGARTVE